MKLFLSLTIDHRRSLCRLPIVRRREQSFCLADEEK